MSATTTGATVGIDGAVEILYNITGAPVTIDARVRIRRDGSTTLATFQFQGRAETLLNQRAVIPFSWTDTPSAGSHTYEVLVNVSTSASYTADALTRSLKVTAP